MICYNCKKEIGDAAACPYCGAVVLKAPLPHHLPFGTLIGGRYRIEGVLGEGGFGITYLGRDNKLGHAVAVKEYYPRGFSYRSNTGTNEVYVSSQADAAFYEHGKERFLSEAKTLARFSEEPGVVSVTDYIEENNTVYLVMEYLRGVTLQQYLKQHGNLSADAAFGMLEPVMRTLEKIHSAGVIHRDISPDNIMVQPNGQLKLMDFGAAKEFVDQSRSMSVMLKKGYAPIEQYDSKSKQGPWTDVYALCATVYRCITGTTPVDSLNRVFADPLQRPSMLGADISPALEDVLLRGLAVRRFDRCQSMTELIQLLAQARHKDEGSQRKKNAKENIVIPVPPQPAVTVPAETEPIKTEPADRFDRSNVLTDNTDNLQKRTPKKSKTGIVIAVTAALLVLVIVAGIIIIKPWRSTGSDSVSRSESLIEDDRADSGNTATESDNHQLDVVTENTNTYEETENSEGYWSASPAVSAGNYHTVGLKKNGTAVATSITETAITQQDYGQSNTGGWMDIVAVSAGGYHTVGLTKNGSVVAVGDTQYGKCDVDSWMNMTAVSAGGGHTVGIKNDGTVIAIGYNGKNQCDVDNWKNITAISTSSGVTVGLKQDGSVVATGLNDDGQCDVGSWTDIISVSAGDFHTVGLKTDGTVVATGNNNHRECDVDDWSDIIAVAAGCYHTVGLKKDGTVVAIGSNKDGQCDVSDWTDIVAVSAGWNHTIGLKRDGTVVATGLIENGQCDVNSWNLNE